MVRPIANCGLPVARIAGAGERRRNDFSSLRLGTTLARSFSSPQQTLTHDSALSQLGDDARSQYWFALGKGTVPFSWEENWDSPQLSCSVTLPDILTVDC